MISKAGSQRASSTDHRLVPEAASMSEPAVYNSTRSRRVKAIVLVAALDASDDLPINAVVHVLMNDVLVGLSFQPLELKAE
jgi:hypothetical protein